MVPPTCCVAWWVFGAVIFGSMVFLTTLIENDTP